MAFQFDYDPANQIFRIRFEGTVTDEEITIAYRFIAVHTERLQPRAGIADFSAVSNFAVTTETIRKLAYSSPAMPNRDVPRFLVAPSSLVFGLSRMFESHGEPTRPKLHVVRSLEEVWAILSIREPRFEPLSPSQD